MILDLFEYFIRTNNTEGVLNFLINGRDPEELLSNSQFPLDAAVQSNARDVYELLLDFGAAAVELFQGNQWER